MGAEFVRIKNVNVTAKSVVGAHFVKHRIVRHVATGGTKDTAYVALSICSRMSAMSVTIRRRGPP